MIKTIRHERLDWTFISGERRLTLVLKDYLGHYNRRRPHLALSLRPPCPEADQLTGPIVRRECLSGLINEYSWVA